MSGGLNASKLAEALNKAAHDFVPKSRGTLAASLEEPEVKEAILNMRRKGMTAVEIVEVLKANGIETTPSSFNSTFGRILRKSKGGSEAKPKRDRKANRSADTSATTPGSSEGKSGEAPKPSVSKPDDTAADTDGAKPNETASATGGDKPKRTLSALNREA